MNTKIFTFSYRCVVFFQNDRGNLQARFQGSTSISSEEYFGDPNKRSTTRSNNSQGPDLSGMKSDFKEGVSKAAGRLSSLASSVMSSIQVNIHHSPSSSSH